MKINFKDDVNKVLERNGYEKQIPALEILIKIVAKNKKYADKKVFLYKWSGFLLLTTIPLISTLISVAYQSGNNANGFFSIPNNVLFPLSLTLTLFTILNSIFRPSDRFSEACRIGIGIEHFIIQFLNELEQLGKENLVGILMLISKKEKEFQKFQFKLIRIFMPIQIPSVKDEETKIDQPLNTEDEKIIQKQPHIESKKLGKNPNILAQISKLLRKKKNVAAT